MPNQSPAAIADRSAQALASELRLASDALAKLRPLLPQVYRAIPDELVEQRIASAGALSLANAATSVRQNQIREELLPLLQRFVTARVPQHDVNKLAENLAATIYSFDQRYQDGANRPDEKRDEYCLARRKFMAELEGRLPNISRRALDSDLIRLFYRPEAAFAEQSTSLVDAMIVARGLAKRDGEPQSPEALERMLFRRLIRAFESRARDKDRAGALPKELSAILAEMPREC